MVRKRVERLSRKYVVTLLLSRNNLDSLATTLDPDDPISMKMDLDNDLRRIESAMDKLVEIKRERLEYYLFSGMTQCQQANALNTSQPNIKRDFLRALKTLIRLIE